MLEIKGQVLHHVHLHLQVPGWLSDLNTLLTRKLPMCLLRLDEISCGRGNVFSFVIIAENFKVFVNDIFDCKVLWMVGEGEWNSVGFCGVSSTVSQSISWAQCLPVVTRVMVTMFFEKLAHILPFAVKVGVVTTEPQSKKLLRE